MNLHENFVGLYHIKNIAFPHNLEGFLHAFTLDAQKLNMRKNYAQKFSDFKMHENKSLQNFQFLRRRSALTLLSW